MKKLYYVLLLLFVVLVISACGNMGTNKGVTITINENIATEYEVDEDIDYRHFFTIRDENGTVTVEDSMIDASDVNISTPGTYKVKISYRGVTKLVYITITEKAQITYTITINEDVNKEIVVGEVSFDYKLLFTINDSNGNNIPVEDSMIDSSNVDLSIAGTYIVHIQYQGVSESVEVRVIDKVLYKITVNTDLPTTFELGVASIDFKSYFSIESLTGETIEVTDDMIDTSQVDLTNAGKFTVEINYEGVSKSLEFTITRKLTIIPAICLSANMQKLKIMISI